jgi:hypothetical protein
MVVMGNLLALSMIDCRFEPCLGQTNNYEIVICCIPAKTDLSQNQNNVFELSNMYNCRLLLQ